MTAPRPKRPTRRRVHDRQTQGAVSREEIVTHMTVAPFDHAMREMERKWGIDRLPELVDTVKAQRWGEVMADLNAAIEANDPAATKAAVEVAVKGLAVMDATAAALGHDPKPPEIIEGEIVENGHHWRFAIMPDENRWPAYEAANPGVLLFSMQQAGIALKDRVENSPAVQEVMKHFPNATVAATRPRTELERELNDEIPF